MRVLLILCFLHSIAANAQRVIGAIGATGGSVAQLETPTKVWYASSIGDLRTKTVNTGDIVHLTNRATPYKVQASAVAGFTTDTAAVIPVNGRFAVLQTEPGNTISFSYWEPVIGSNATIDQQKANMVKFRSAVKWCEIYGLELLLPKGVLMIYYTGTNINLAADSHVKIRGAGRKNTVLEIRPSWPTADAPTGPKLFETNTQHSFTMSDMSINGPQYSATHERYFAILKHNAANQVKIQDTVNIRPGFWSDLAVGQTFWSRRSFGDNSTFYASTIAAFDSVTRVITASANLNAAIADNEIGSGTTIYFRFLPTTPTATVAAWGRRANLNSDRPLFNNSAGQASFDKKHTILFKDIETLYCIFNKSGSGADMIFENCIIGADHTISMFPGEYANPSKLIIRNTILENSGRYLDGDGTDANNHSIYAHPNVPIIFEHSIMRNSKYFGLHCYSGSGSKPVNNSFVNSSFTNSIFENTGNITNWDVPSVFTDCRFYGGNIQLGHKTTFNNCDLVNIATNPAYDPSAYNIPTFTFNNCRMTNFTVGGWGSNTLTLRDADTKLIVYANNCTFNNGLPHGPAASLRPSTLYPRLYVNNATIVTSDGLNLIGGWAKVEVNGLNILGGITNTLSYMSSVTPFIPAKPVEIRNADIRRIGRTQTHDSGSVVESDINFYNSVVTHVSYYGGFTVHSFKQNTARGVISGNTLQVKSTADTYYVPSGTINVISVDSLNSGSFGAIELKIICTGDSITFNSYNSVDTSGRNIIAENDKLYRNEMAKFVWVPMPMGSGRVTNTSTLFTGDGTKTRFISGYPNVGGLSYKVIPGSMRLIDPFISDYDDGANIITHANLTIGKRSYVTNRYLFEFISAPENGQNVVLEFDRYTTQHISGYWKRVD